MSRKPLIADLSVDHDLYRPVEHIAPFLPEGFRSWSPQKGELHPDLERATHVILTGSTASIVAPPAWTPEVESLVRVATAERIPMLGICFGHQLIARTALGGVRRSPTPELGWVEHHTRATHNPHFKLPRRFFDFMAHLDEVSELPRGFERLARTADCPVAAMVHRSAPILGVQFHPEIGLHDGRQVVDVFPHLFPRYQAAAREELATPRDDGVGARIFKQLLKL